MSADQSILLPSSAARAATLDEPYAPVWSGQHVKPQILPSPVSHPAFERLLRRLPDEHRRALSFEQLNALALASIPPPPNHKVEYRVSLPFFGQRYYATFYFGRERRSRTRLVAEGQLPTMQFIKPDPVAWTLMLALTGFGILLSLFLLKAMLGIDLMQDGAMFPDAFQHLTDAVVPPN